MIKEQLTPKEKLNLQFIQYAEEYNTLSKLIEQKELDGEDVEMEEYERQYVLYENLDSILERAAKLGAVALDENRNT